MRLSSLTVAVVKGMSHGDCLSMRGAIQAEVARASGKEPREVKRLFGLLEAIGERLAVLTRSNDERRMMHTKLAERKRVLPQARVKVMDTGHTGWTLEKSSKVFVD